MQLLKQSTAKTEKFGPFVDSTDGNTQEVALTISQADIRLSKNGGAFAQTNNAAGATHDEVGWYGVPLDTTDTATLGTLTVAIHESGSLPVWRDFLVVPANEYDSLVSGSDALQVHMTEITAGLIAAATFAAGAIDAAAVADGAIDAATFAAGAINAAAVADGAIDAATFAAGAINAAAIADAAIDNATFAADVQSTAYASNIIAQAVTKTLIEHNLDHWMKTAVANNADMTAEVPDGTVASNMMTMTGDTSDFVPATDSLEGIGTKTTLITSSSTLIAGIVSTGDVITIYQGETRRNDEGTAIRMDIDGTTSDLTGHTPKLGLTKITTNSGSATLEVTGTLVNAGLATQYVYFELTAAQTTALAVDTTATHGYRISGNYAYRWTIGSYKAAANCPTFGYGDCSVKARDITCA